MIELSIGGASWDGWLFGPYGRAREWRLFDAVGTYYTAAEVAEVRELAADVDYLRVQLAAIRAQRAALTPDEAAILRAAADVLARLASPYRVTSCGKTARQSRTQLQTRTPSRADRSR